MDKSARKMSAPLKFKTQVDSINGPEFAPEHSGLSLFGTSETTSLQGG
jgi:hypothetical protein